MKKKDFEKYIGKTFLIRRTDVTFLVHLANNDFNISSNEYFSCIEISDSHDNYTGLDLGDNFALAVAPNLTKPYKIDTLIFKNNTLIETIEIDIESLKLYLALESYTDNDKDTNNDINTYLKECGVKLYEK